MRCFSSSFQHQCQAKSFIDSPERSQVGRLNRIYIGTNTKMYQTPSQAAAYLAELTALTKDISADDLTLFVIPSFTSLERAGRVTENSSIILGAQNMHWEEKGQFTGEISPPMLKETGVSIIEIGHSERRHIFQETDDDIEKKVRAAVIHGFTALLCVGETLKQRQWEVADEILRLQLKIGLHAISPRQYSQIWIAYEPVWAIGENGIPATAEYVAARHKIIRETLAEQFGQAAALEIPVLYGGSVNLENTPDLIKTPNVDGLFVGRSAWEAPRFNQLIRSAMSCFKSL